MKECLALAAAFLCVGAAAHAADSADWITDPAHSVASSAHFDGLYGGVVVGMAGADHGNFWPTGDIDRYGIGAIAGWTTYLAPRVVVGAEVQGHIDFDFAGTIDTAALIFGRLGFTTSETFMVHVLGGGGLFGDVPAWAFGAGFEWGVQENVSLRADIITLGEAGPDPVIEGVTAWIIKGGPVWRFGDTGVTTSGAFPAAAVAATGFDGPYLGLSYGIHIDQTWHFFPDTGNGWHMTRGHIGGFAGWNFRITDDALKVVVGGEIQAHFLYDTSGDMGSEVLALGRVGVVPMEGLLVYAAGGAGLVQDTPAYALGGGAEYALWGDASVRLESLAIGDASAFDGFVANRTTLGAVWHLR